VSKAVRSHWADANAKKEGRVRRGGGRWRWERCVRVLAVK
jgi:hypothetical protein